MGQGLSFGDSNSFGHKLSAAAQFSALTHEFGFVQSKYSKISFLATNLQFLLFISDSKHLQPNDNNLKVLCDLN